jgi:hypothetical protein
VKDIAVNIIEMRKNRNLSKEKMSKVLHISILDIDDYENCKKEVPLNILIRYSNYFSIPLDTICKSKIISEEIKREKQCRIIMELFKKLKVAGIDVEKLSDVEMERLTNVIIFVVKNKFSNEQNRVVFSLMKIIGRCNYDRDHLEGVIEMLDILDIGSKSLFTNNKLYDIMRDLQKIMA